MGEIERLAAFSDAPAPAVTRVLYTPTDLAARAYLKSLFAEADLELREDALGNLFARWVGAEPDLPAVGTGSHTDAIPYAGRYDGVVGVLGGLEAIRALQRAGFRPRRSVELLMFTAEEPTRFGVGCLGSRALSGAWTAEMLERLRDSEGKSLDEARTEAGFSGGLETVRLPEGYYSAFVELHIEQGPLLERENLPLGIVTAIAAPASLVVRLNGQGGHAGAVLMSERRDALLAGAEIALEVERATLATGAPDTVGTTGVFKVHPGAINSIPSRVELGIDLRDIDGVRRDGVVERVVAAVGKICQRRGIDYEVEVLNADPPAQSGEEVVRALEASARELALPYRKMVSRAYHDSLFMARLCPTAMLFIPCKNGWSHRPDEYASPEHIELGVRVLARTLARLAS
ncbi:Zn-dependent hydrolase [Meiothermus sp. PNK-Is4]|nr:Zn-dependent hydrolase [Meiothermus sp. Pnk-1]RYM37122.1 Zn-dependent hydrolase [Meiothermus sp. PNK-Is4]